MEGLYIEQESIYMYMHFFIIYKREAGREGGSVRGGKGWKEGGSEEWKWSCERERDGSKGDSEGGEDEVRLAFWRLGAGV